MSEIRVDKIQVPRGLNRLNVEQKPQPRYFAKRHTPEFLDNLSTLQETSEYPLAIGSEFGNVKVEIRRILIRESVHTGLMAGSHGAP